MQPEERAETGRLVGFGLRGATGVVRDVHGAIADTAFGTVRRYLGPLGRPVVTPVEIAHDTIAGGVYAITGTTLELAGTATGLVAGRAPQAPTDDPRGPGTLADSPRARTLMALLHGFHGDKLAAQGSAVSYPMTLRRSGRDIPVTAEGLATAYPEATGTVVVFVHGFIGTEQMWKRRPDGDDPDATPHSYGRRLEDELDVSSVWVRYNTGLRVSTNGAQLRALLRGLHAAWPVPITRIVLVGHSMGGLVAHSALAQAEADEPWVQATTDTITLGTPHHGTPLERSANAVAGGLATSERTRWAADIIRYRSDGIRDMRHGNLVDADWSGHDPEEPGDRRTGARPHPHVAHLAVVATVARDPDSRRARWFGDLVVGADSARGLGRSEPVHLGGLTHLDLLNHERVYPLIRDRVAHGPG
ncbi:hypothetical protein GCM10027055_02180 [Janibacter alkaliphilus]|uniref:Pimeloyl-ACP methyl ester carboxylesterase n=1 Tax=Janibacter alkaliphilus TaxID=1069963 RepID=A0A852X7T8_9MICO|nr:alpha/beta hydrolase [Janibacter alkaliphilus]NYG36833.1 pimeloyl-ACP methyl ester carboxylesterase [Janibacter alkaliphilus]